MQIDSDSYVRIHMYRAKEELLPGGFRASYVCMSVRVHACVCVCQSCAGMYAVDSTYQPLTVAWVGVLLVWQPLPPPSPPPAPQPRPPHSPPLHPLQFQPTASCPTNTCTHTYTVQRR